VSLSGRNQFRWEGIAGHQHGLARDRYAAVDLLKTGLGLSTNRARIAWVGVGDDPRGAGLKQTLDEQADEGRAAALL
jgi:hypothetical protein